MATTVARLEAILSANTRDFDRGMDRSGKKMGDTHRMISKAARLAGFAVIGGLGLAVNAAAGFESSLNNLQAVSHSTGAEMDQIKKKAMALGADMKLPATSAADAADAMTELVKAGLSVKDTLAAARPVLVLSAAANIGNARAAEIAANALNAFGLQGKEAAMVADQLANVANASSVEISDVADSFTMAAAVFSGFQGPVLGAKGAMTELNVAIGLLGNAGIKGSDAGTSLKQMILQLTGPSKTAKNAMKGLYFATQDSTIGQKLMTQALTGTKKEQEKALDVISKMKDVTQDGGDIAYTAAGKMRPLKEIIRLTYLGTRKLTQEQRNQAITTIFGADATRSVIALMKAGAPAWEHMTKKVKERGTAEDLAAAKMKGFKGTVEGLKSSLESLEIGIGTGLLPFVTALARSLSVVSAAAANHTTTTKILIGTVAAFAAVVFLANTYMKIMASTFVTKVIPALVKTTAVQWLLNVAAGAFPVILIVAGLIAVGVAVYVFRDKLMTAFNWIKDHWPLLLGILTGPIGLAIVEIVQHRDKIVQILKDLPAQVADFFKTEGKKIVKAAIVGLFSQVIDWVKEVLGIHSPSAVFHEMGVNMVKGFANGVGSAKGLLKKAVVGMVKSVAGKFTGLLDGGGSSQGSRGYTSGGLQPQVLNAVAYARQHGWQGQVTSGFRSYAEQAALYQRYLAGGPLAAPPGHSSHESGSAVDVTDYATFGRIMSSAPAFERLYNHLGARDPVHYSISGYEKGGVVPGYGAQLAVVHGGETITPAGRGGGTHFYFPNYVGSKQDLINMLKSAMKQDRRRGGLGFA